MFTTEQTGENRWRGLRFDGAGSSYSELAYCLIEKGYATGIWPNDRGGGVFCQQSSPTFTNCSIRGNSTDSDGGGVYFVEYSSGSFTNCSISGNSAGAGGGVLCYDSSPTFTRCTLSSNSANYGGGISCVEYSNPTFTNCSIRGNSAGVGGGIYNYYLSGPTFAHCTFSDNSASYGGGVYCDNASLTIKSTVIAFSTGAGIYFAYSAGSQVGYCDLFGNEGGNIGFWDNDPSHGPPGIGQLTATNANGDPCDTYRNIFLDPLFVNGPGGNFHLTDASHCIGAANPSSPPPTDFEGDPRPNPMGSNPDIGMDEHWLGCPVGRLVITMVSGNAVLYWPFFANTVNIYGATAPYTSGTLLTTVYGVTTWTDLQTSSRPSPYFYYVKATE